MHRPCKINHIAVQGLLQTESVQTPDIHIMHDTRPRLTLSVIKYKCFLVHIIFSLLIPHFFLIDTSLSWPAVLSVLNYTSLSWPAVPQLALHSQKGQFLYASVRFYPRVKFCRTEQAEPQARQSGTAGTPSGGCAPHLLYAWSVWQ
jgi:hypothetical protein